MHLTCSTQLVAVDRKETRLSWAWLGGRSQEAVLVLLSLVGQWRDAPGQLASQLSARKGASQLSARKGDPQKAPNCVCTAAHSHHADAEHGCIWLYVRPGPCRCSKGARCVPPQSD